MINDSDTFLLVDDSENDLLLMRAAFKRADVKNPVQEVRNGEEAIAYLQGEGSYADRTRYPLPKVMMLDINMPMKNGFEVLQWLREQPGLKRLMVAVLTASARQEDVDRALDLGANAFLIKPTRVQELADMVRSLRGWLEYNQFGALDR